LAGMSLSNYLLNAIREMAERPSVEELRERLQRRSRVMVSTAPAEIIRAERDRK
jgi:antitoxin FitA